MFPLELPNAIFIRTIAPSMPCTVIVWWGRFALPEAVGMVNDCAPLVLVGMNFSHRERYANGKND